MKQRRNLWTVDAILVGLTMMASLTVITLSAFAVTTSPPPSSQLAQATTPQNAPAQPAVPAGKQDGPAESKPGGTRPTTPPPEPARPDPEAQKAGAQPALPAAPAEKMGEPVRK